MGSKSSFIWGQAPAASSSLNNKDREVPLQMFLQRNQWGWIVISATA